MAGSVDRTALELHARARVIKQHVLGRRPETERWAGETWDMRPAAPVDAGNVTNAASAIDREAA
jgi:hypothetical protein